jgi:polygalacturonase
MGPEEKAAYVLKEFDVFDRRPHVMTLVNFTDLVIRDLTIRNSAYWCVHLIGCDNVVIHGIRLENSLKVRNSDGIDIDHSRNVTISKCFIESGDDCICFKTRREYEECGPTEHVVVSDCTMTSTSCSIKFGSENMDAIRDVEVRDCIIRSSNRGIGIQNRDEGVVEDIRFKNISVEGRLFDDVWWGKAEPLYVTAYKRKPSGGKDANVRFAKGQTEGKVGVVRNISFVNIECRSENGIFVGGEEGKVENILFDGVVLHLEKITSRTGGVYDLRPSDTVGLLATGTSGFLAIDAKDITICDSAVHWGTRLAPYFGSALRAIRVNGLTLAGFKGESAVAGGKAVETENCTDVTIR